MKEKCRSCGAEIYWAKTEAGKLMPVDAEPAEDGNCVLYAPLLGDGLTRELRVLVYRSREVETLRELVKVVTLEKAEDHQLTQLGKDRARAIECFREGKQRKSHFATCPDADRHRRRK